MRIDKYLWAVRLAKTRTIASKLCVSDKVQINEDPIKPSKEVSIGDIIRMRDNPTWRTYQVIDKPKTRVGAKLVKDFLLETTDQSELDKIKLVQEMNRQNRFHGIVGRPTKRDRRDLDRYRTSDD